MHIRCLYGPDGGGLINVKDNVSSRYYVMDGREYIDGVTWVDQNQILVGLQNGRLLLVNTDNGQILAQVQGEARVRLIVSTDMKSAWAIGKRIDHYSLPELSLISSSFGLRHIGADRWKCIQSRGDVPKERYSRDFREFRYGLHDNWTSLNGNKLMGTAPAAGLAHDDREKQGTELIELYFETMEARIQRLPNTDREPTRPVLSISPDGRYALRAHLEPIAKSRRWLPGPFTDKGKIEYGRKGSPPILFYDDVTAVSAHNQVGFPLELWRIDSQYQLEGLIIPEWYSLDTLKKLDASHVFGHRIKDVAFVNRNLASTLGQLGCPDIKISEETYGKLQFSFKFARNFFHAVKQLNRIEEPQLNTIFRMDIGHVNSDYIRWFAETFVRFGKKSHAIPTWLPVATKSAVVLSGPLGISCQIEIDATSGETQLQQVDCVQPARVIDIHSHCIDEDEERTAKRLVNKSRFGIVSIAGKTEKHYVKALEKLCAHFERDSKKLVHDGRYEPTFKRGSSFMSENEICIHIVENNFAKCIPILDRLLLASKQFHGEKTLSVWHPCDDVVTCAPMAFARFQLAGELGEIAFDWLLGLDVGHDLYCYDELSRLAELLPMNRMGFAQIACMFYWHQYFDGNIDDVRNMPFYLAAQKHISAEEFRSILTSTLEKLFERDERYKSMILKDLKSRNLQGGMSSIVDWSLT